MTDQTHPLSAELLDRYLTGECTLAEVEQVRAWLTEYPEHDRAMAVFRAIDFEPGRSGGNTPWDSPSLDDAWGRFEQRCLAETGIPVVSDSSAKRRVETEHRTRWTLQQGLSGLRNGWLRNGSTVGIVTVLGIVALSWMFGLSGRISRTDTAAVRRTFTTAVGQRETIHLTDGSRVTLAPSSTLEIPSEFGRGTRSVTLTGEAHFEVTASARMPFAVHTGNVRTDVLGTTFVVRRYADDGYTRVAVTTGRVSVAAVADQGAVRHPTVVLAAGMLGEVTDTTALATAATDMSAYTGWTQGQLAFHHTPVPQALAMLERWYGYQFRIADSVLLQRDLTATFDEKDSSNMLMTLRTVLDVTMTLDGAIVTLRSRNTSGAVSRDNVRNSSFHPSRKE